MLRIGVCGDERQYKKQMEALIKKWGVVCEIVWLGTEEDILNNKKEVDVWIVATVQMEEKGLEHIVKTAAGREGAGEKGQAIVVKSGTTYQHILKKDIVYAENNGRKIVLYLEDDSVEFYGKMEDLEKELGQEFFRCHRGYLVAMSKIKGYDTGNIYLKNGKEVYLAKRKYGEFKERYIRYIQEGKV